MASITLPGTGAQVKVDPVAGEDVQVVKVAHGTSGAATLTSGTDPLPVVQTGALTADVGDMPASSASTDTVGAVVDALRVQDGLASLPVKFAPVDASASGDNTLVAAVTGSALRVLSITLVAVGAVTATLKSGASTARSGGMPLAANGGLTAQAPQGLVETASGEALVLGLSAAVAVGGMVSYVERPVA